MEKFESIELARENTNPTSLCKIYLEYIKHFSKISQNLEFIEEYIRCGTTSLNVDGELLIKEIEVFIKDHSEITSKSEKENNLESVGIHLILIPAAFSIQAIQAHSNGQDNEAWLHAIDASYWVGMLKSRELFSAGKNNMNVLSLNGLKGALTRLSACPKQKALKEIEAHYLAVKSQFKRRGYSAQFIREMHSKYPEITAIKTIENLVGTLNTENELIPR